MDEHGEDEVVFEIGVVVRKGKEKQEDEDSNCIEVLVNEFRKVGLIVERIVGLQNQYIKLAAPMEVFGRAAAELQMRKQTHIGVDLQFVFEEIEAFTRQPDGSLFSWSERYHCYNHIIYGIVNTSMSAVTLKSDNRVVQWNVGESILRKLESAKVVKDVFPLHDEKTRKKLLKTWALKWRDVSAQPIDEICAYYGTKIATYFAFLGMYSRWMLVPAAFGITVQLVDFGSMQLWVLPIFFISVVSWAVLFFQFWRRKNSAILARWQMNCSAAVDRNGFSDNEPSSHQLPSEVRKKLGIDRVSEKEAFQREEWSGGLMRLRNDSIIISSIIFLQLPLELAYAHLYEILGTDLLKFSLTAVYIFIIRYFTKVSGKFSVKLVKRENNKNIEYRADSLVYKVFGLYFMQSYIGIFYHALLHRNFKTLRTILIQRLIVSEVMENLTVNSLPYLRYNFKKYRAIRRNKRKHEEGKYLGKVRTITRVEKEYLKPAYSASIGEELEDGLFDDFLEISLQFGMIMMFACAFPLGFAFATLNNLTEIRTDALKLLAVLRRPTPRETTTIGAWLNIFQFLIVMSICTNCALLVWLYDQEGQWNISPGLAAIIVMEHILLFIKFGFSKMVPEEPAWVKAKRMKNATQAQDICSKELLKTISSHKVD